MEKIDLVIILNLIHQQLVSQNLKIDWTITD